MDLFMIYIIGLITSAVMLLVIMVVTMQNDSKVTITAKDIIGSVCGIIVWPVFWLLVIVSRLRR